MVTITMVVKTLEVATVEELPPDVLKVAEKEHGWTMLPGDIIERTAPNSDEVLLLSQVSLDRAIAKMINIMGIHPEYNIFIYDGEYYSPAYFSGGKVAPRLVLP